MGRLRSGRCYWLVCKTALIWLLFLCVIYSAIYLTQDSSDVSFFPIWSVYLLGFEFLSVYIAERLRFFGLFSGLIAVVCYVVFVIITDRFSIFQCNESTDPECWVGFAAGVAPLMVSAYIICNVCLLSSYYFVVEKKQLRLVGRKGKTFSTFIILISLLSFVFAEVYIFTKGETVGGFLVYGFLLLTSFYLGRSFRKTTILFWRLNLLAVFLFVLAATFLSSFMMSSMNSDVIIEDIMAVRLLPISMIVFAVTGVLIKPYRYFRKVQSGQEAMPSASVEVR